MPLIRSTPVATGQSRPTARATGGRARGDSIRMAPPVSLLMASPSRVGQRRPTAYRRLGPRRVLRRPASLPSWHTPGRTGLLPLLDSQARYARWQTAYRALK